MKRMECLGRYLPGARAEAVAFLSQYGEFKSSGFKDLLRGHVEDVNLFL
jgi:hypothetical protein